MLIRRAFAITAVCLLASCGEPTEPDGVVQVTIQGPDTLQLASLGVAVSLSATVSVSEGTVPPTSWRSTDENVIDVRDGSALSVGNGTAMIIASAEDAADTVTAIVDQVPVAIEFARRPADAAVNETPILPTVVVVLDNNGVPVQNLSGAVTVTLVNNPGGANLTGTTTRPIQSGVAEFTDLRMDAPGDGYTLGASSGGFSIESDPFSILVSPDLIRFHNTADTEIGTFLDGHSAFFVNDLVETTDDSSVTTVFGSGSPLGEIAAFTVGRPPSVTTPGWTSGVDTVDVTFRDIIRIRVTAWIIAGPFSALQDRAISQAATTTAVWLSERMGVEFEEFEIVDATGDPDASRLQETTQCNQQSLARASIGERVGRINLYYVGVVDGGHDRGYSCGNTIFMADRSGHELLAHELGHSFGLGHVDNLTGYDQTNVMHSASNTRAFLTEGQVFRSHYNTYSALNDLYAIRPSGLRSCFDSAVSEECPSLIRRIWADGAFGPNE